MKKMEKNHLLWRKVQEGRIGKGVRKTADFKGVRRPSEGSERKTADSEEGLPRGWRGPP